MLQQGQVFPLSSRNGAEPRWAYRYRVGGRGSRRVQRGGFASEQAAVEALERALERLRREQGLVETPTLREFVEVYLSQHGGEPETIDKLRWLLSKALRVFGDRRLGQLRPPEIAAWRMTIPPGHRFEATQALRQVLNRAIDWGLIDVNPARRESTTRSGVARRSARSNHGPKLSRSQPNSAPPTGRWLCSLPRPACVRASGSRLSGATSTETSRSPTSAAASETVGSSTQRPRRACAPSRSKPAPLPPSTRSRASDGAP